ncbi:hypothetical protein [Chamaesiphon sp. VAR_48_metabat_135_sub]|uniref:hypothetical protein n=1 Tax=Chamaesiphon sp. VAR_48_metabat_135_sub TaxID=2964699 RepID=UPI00286D1BFF|nr:hypothetical protein [Chamaesiphon sp. VAR_48_metabat_135_sub]
MSIEASSSTIETETTLTISHKVDRIETITRAQVTLLFRTLNLESHLNSLFLYPQQY